MNQSQDIYTNFIGFDVSKHTIAVHNHAAGTTEDIKNSPSDLRTFVRSLPHTCLAICEPTGGYEASLLTALTAAQVPVHRADARKVKAFIRSLGIYGKTDTLDARALAEYAQERHQRLPLWSPMASNLLELQILVARRQELIALQTAEKNRSQAPLTNQKAGRYVKASCTRMLKMIALEIQKAQTAIEAIIKADEHLQDMQGVLMEVKGIGPVVAATLLASMPELGHLTRRQVASLAGLAPHPRQSGKTEHYRRVCGGRREVKRILFMAAMVAARHNPDLKAFYDRLIKNGKKPLVALTALMRKLIVILNAKIRDHIAQKQMS